MREALKVSFCILKEQKMFFLRKILKITSIWGGGGWGRSKLQLCSTKMRNFLRITIYYAFEGKFRGRQVVGGVTSS